MLLSSKLLVRPVRAVLARQPHNQRRYLRVSAFKEDPKPPEPKEVAKQSAPAPEAVQLRRADDIPFRRMGSMLGELQRMSREMDRVFDELSPFGGMGMRSSFFPDFERLMPMDFPARTFAATLPLEVAEDEKAYTITAEVPGFSKDEVKVMLSPNNTMLTISGQKGEEGEEKGAKGEVMARSRRMQTFSRSFTLPPAVDADSIKATTQHGVLTLTLPKMELPPPPPPKEIPVVGADAAQ